MITCPTLCADPGNQWGLHCHCNNMNISIFLQEFNEKYEIKKHFLKKIICFNKSISYPVFFGYSDDTCQSFNTF